MSINQSISFSCIMCHFHQFTKVQSGVFVSGDFFPGEYCSGHFVWGHFVRLSRWHMASITSAWNCRTLSKQCQLKQKYIAIKWSLCLIDCCHKPFEAPKTQRFYSSITYHHKPETSSRNVYLVETALTMQGSRWCRFSVMSSLWCLK